MADRTVFNSMTQRHVISLVPTGTVHEAAQVMTRSNSSSLLVIDASGTMMGIVTERDLMTKVLAKSADPATTTMADIMTRNPTTITPECKVSDAVLIMIERGFRHLPVVNEQGKILGVFSARDALPREINTAIEMAEFHEQVNDALG